MPQNPEFPTTPDTEPMLDILRAQLRALESTESPDVYAAMCTLQRHYLETIAELGWRVERWVDDDPNAPFADEPDIGLLRRHRALRYRFVDTDGQTLCYVLELPCLLSSRELEALLRLRARGWRVRVFGTALGAAGLDLQIEFWPPVRDDVKR